MADRESRRDRDDQNFCCCKDEMASILRNINRGSCSEVEVILTTGSECCSITGTICDIRNNGCILVLVETQQNGPGASQGPPQRSRRGKVFISVDKIAAVSEVCGNGFLPDE
ncbi:MAG: hypothetical protein ACOC4G_05875 [Bacillota bacterium]